MPVRFASALAVLAFAALAAGQPPAGLPQLSSRPGAAYTLYLNMGGFNFTGTWGGSGKAPGVVPAYSTDANTAAYTATEIANMRQIWARTAEKYSSYNINVTTADPAPAGATDAQRQLYYESTPRVMHSVLGGSNAWYGNAGGVSYVNVVAGTGTPSGNGGAGAGYKTNWSFPANLSGGNPKSVSEAAAHEDGHALGLSHQARWSNGVLQATYDTGVNTANALAPIMGVAYSTTRGVWRVGATNSNSSPTAQNDVRRIQQNAGIQFATTTGFVNDGIGRSTATATALPLTGTTVNFAAAKGVITPLSSTAPNPIGEANYTAGYYFFDVAPGTTADAVLVLRSGTSTIASGTADPGATLDATFRLLDAAGAPLLTANTNTFAETIAADDLAAGRYYLQVASAGGFTDVNNYQYFDMGSYFITGTLVFAPVPEPAFALLLAVGVLVRRRAA